MATADPVLNVDSLKFAELDTLSSSANSEYLPPSLSPEPAATADVQIDIGSGDIGGGSSKSSSTPAVDAGMGRMPSLRGMAASAALGSLLSGGAASFLGGAGGGGGGVGVGRSGEPGAQHNFWTLAYYQQFFDVDTNVVTSRLMKSLNPVSGPFIEEGVQADLYGPFWIASTLILLTAATGNLADYFAFLPTDERVAWQYDFQKVTLAASVFYCYISMVPFAVWLALKRLDVTVPFTEIVALYGYSMFIFVPSSVVCIFPYELLRWLTLFVATSLSSYFLLRNLWNHCMSSSSLAQDLGIGPVQKKKVLTVMAGVGIAQVAIMLLIKLYFFHYKSYA